MLNKTKQNEIDVTNCRRFSRTSTVAVLIAVSTITSAFSAEPVDVGSRLELFVDDHLIGEIDGDVRQQLLRPEPKEVVFTADSLAIDVNMNKPPLTNLRGVTVPWVNAMGSAPQASSCAF